jgi:hypothetical protein
MLCCSMRTPTRTSCSVAGWGRLDKLLRCLLRLCCRWCGRWRWLPCSTQEGTTCTTRWRCTGRSLLRRLRQRRRCPSTWQRSAGTPRWRWRRGTTCTWSWCCRARGPHLTMLGRSSSTSGPPDGTHRWRRTTRSRCSCCRRCCSPWRRCTSCSTAAMRLCAGRG